MPVPKVSPSGVTAIETILGEVTVSVAVCVRPDKLAEIFAVPAASELASPLALIVATAGAEELHVTTLLRSALLPSV